MSLSDREQSGREFAQSVLIGRVETLHKELLGLVSEISEEAVHQTRIASRRMRAALEIFREKIPVRSFDSVYREVRHITRILGAPRESAVCLQLIEKLAKIKDKEDPCLQYLHKRFASRLKKQERQLRKKLNRIDPARLRSRLESLLIETHNGALEPAAHLMAGLIAPIFEFPADQRFDLATDEDLHSLRVAAKKARYAMEIYSPLWPGGLSDRIQKARKFQQAAGKYNDLCMLCRHLESEFKRLDSSDSIQLAFQIGKLSAYAEVDKANLRTGMRAALIEFQESLGSLSQEEKLHVKSDMHALLPANSKSRPKKISKIVKTGR